MSEYEIECDIILNKFKELREREMEKSEIGYKHLYDKTIKNMSPEKIKKLNMLIDNDKMNARTICPTPLNKLINAIMVLREDEKELFSLMKVNTGHGEYIQSNDSIKIFLKINNMYNTNIENLLNEFLYYFEEKLNMFVSKDNVCLSKKIGERDYILLIHNIHAQSINVKKLALNFIKDYPEYKTNIDLTCYENKAIIHLPYQLLKGFEPLYYYMLRGKCSNCILHVLDKNSTNLNKLISEI